MAIQAYRLNRLFEHISREPSTALPQHLATCGFESQEAGNRELVAEFGIDLTQFHRDSR